MRKLLLATNNAGKVKEFCSLLGDAPFQLVTLATEGTTARFQESGRTFEENARGKAVFYRELSGLLTLADDSGLEVDALGGEPGVMSARYAGEHASDQDNIRKLLSKLEQVPRERRAARFRCIIAIAGVSGEVATCEGECAGVIEFQPRGELGFGYDPVFFIPELGKTMAELTMEEKNEISHRARALRAARILLEQFRD